MSINRFQKFVNPGQIQVTPWQLPFNELAAGLLGKQAIQDEGIKELDANAELTKSLNSLSPDREKHLLIDNYINQSVDNLSYGVDLTSPEGQSQIQKIKSDVRNLFGPSGEASAIQANYNAFQEWDKSQQERLKKGDISKEFYEAGKNTYLKNYADEGGIGQKDSSTGMYNSFKAGELAEYVDAPTTLSNYVKDIKASSKSTEIDNVTGDPKWIITTANGTKSVTEQEILEIAYGKMLNDDKLKSYYSQAEEFGLIPKGSFTQEPVFKSIYKDTKGNIIDEETFNSLDVKEQSKLYKQDYLNPNFALSPAMKAVAQEYSFDETTFSKTYSANDYYKMDYQYELDNAMDEIQFNSEGITTYSPWGNTPESMNEYIDKLQSHNQVLVDESLEAAGLGKFKGTISGKEWLTGNIPAHIRKYFSQEKLDEISRNLTVNEVQSSIAEQTLSQAQQNAGIQDLNKTDLDLINTINSLPDGELTLGNNQGTYTKDMLTKAMGKTSRLDTKLYKPGDFDYYFDGNKLMKNTKVNDVSYKQTLVAIVPKEIATKVSNVSNSVKLYNENLEKEVEKLGKQVTSVPMTSNAYWLDGSVESQKRFNNTIEGVLKDPAFTNDMMVTLTESDITNLEEISGENLKKYVQNGKIAFGNLSRIMKVERGESSLMYSQEPLPNGTRVTGVSYKATNPDGDKVYDFTAHIELGQNGLYNKEINATLNSSTAEAQELVNRPKNSNVENFEYVDPRIPNVTFKNNGVLTNGVLYTGSEIVQSVAYELEEDKAIKSLLVEPDGQRIYNNAKQLAKDKNISVLEAIQYIKLKQ